MHHPEPAGDSGSVRKMPHPTVFHRRGSNTSSGSGSTLSATVNNSHVSAEDYQPSLLIQPPAASSSPGPHHPPPHSLNLQPQPSQQTGAQIKKKSGFQITSVTPATIVSTNNSIAEDTESYDDLDESHTEDLSSSEILDVSLSRANDAVGAERSSSEETLNNFQEAETPGAVSPNQPSHPGTLTQAQQRGGAIVNGTMHHHHHLNPNQTYPLTGALPSLTQKMPSNVGGPQENVSHAAPQTIVPQSVGIVAPGSAPGMHSSATGTTVSVVNPPTSSSVNNVNMSGSANVPVRGGIGTSAGSSGGGSFPPNVMSSAGGGGLTGASHVSAANINPIQQQQNINSMTTASAASVSASGGGGVPSGIQGRVGSAASLPAAAVPSAVPAPAVTATTSRFRVVKLDSSSEPFKKGRWMCTEFYDKDAPTPAPSASVSEAASLSSRQFMTESLAGASERESTSGSSVSSTISTLSHYIENMGSGEASGSPGPQHAQDYASPPQGYQGIHSGLSVGVPQSQAHMHIQDMSHPHGKTAAAPSAPANIHQPAAMPGQQTAVGAVPPQQLTYAQAVANQAPNSSQGLVNIQQQKISYPNLPQQSAPSPPAPPVSVRPPEYNQSQQGVPQAAASQPLSNQAGTVPAGQANGVTPMMGGPQQTQGLLHTQPPASSMPPHVGLTGLGQPQNLQGHVDVQQKPQSLPTQIQNTGPNTQLPAAAHQNQASASSVPPPSAHNDHLAQPQAANVPRMPPQPSSISLTQDSSSAQALAHAAQANALYASLPSFTTTQLQDAQRLLLQHQSFLKLPGGDTGSNTGPGQETEGNTNAANALTAPAGLKPADGEDDGSSGASVVAIDNKIEQAMDLVKSHLMYAVREEVEVLKEQIKTLIEQNSQLEQENTLLKKLASPEQMAQFQAKVQTGSPPAPQTDAPTGPPSAAGLIQPATHSSGPSA
ncbi:PREDICTED: TSC22 domain family protein 1-like [Cyprinodon variegatus]|uniref:TSC22 domain family protein 1 n=1 Tax=Cyprinodon variegatus TaxID=28743 RepID=A0A3Q2E8S4_CYPVA|nr:PREDICTED: TSC22 domain family protein 1-like [Cyprinodon variegatus]